MTDYVTKPIPHNTEAEEAVLGSLLIDRDAVIKIAPFLKPGDFYHDTHKQVYEAVLSLYERREPPDAVTLANELQRRGYTEIARFMDWVNHTPTAVHIEHYARIVEKYAILRRLISAGGDIAGLGWTENDNIDEVLADADRLLLAVHSSRGKRNYQGMTEMLNAYSERLDAISSSPGEVVGLRTGLSGLDSYISGYQKNKLVILAARPGQGKTSLILNQAKTIARAGVGVGIFSLEMSADELMERWYSDEAHLDSKKLRNGHNLSDRDWGNIANATSSLSELPMWVNDQASMTISELRASAFRMRAEHNIGILFVDYLGLIQAPRKDNNRVLEVGEVARKLKILARELEIPVVACAQLNRDADKRNNHVPILSDLRDSGEIEAHADIVMFLHRPELYEPDKLEHIGKAELHIAKHRGGPLGMVPLHFVKEHTRFHSTTQAYGQAA